ncbi:MAG: hypothetical protein ACR2O4_07030 [Hyphomicrobiaceae bacterium]
MRNVIKAFLDHKYVWWLMAVPWGLAIFVYKISGDQLLGHAVAVALHAVSWLGLSYLILHNVPEEGGKSVVTNQSPVILERISGTMKYALGILFLVACIAAVFVLTRDETIVAGLGKVFWAPGYIALLGPWYALLGGLLIGYCLVPALALRNRPHPESVKRCLVDVLDVGLSLSVAMIAGMVALFTVYFVTGLIQPLVPLAMLVTGGLFIWRTLPYCRPAVRFLMQRPV